jgi:hypothetical protein
MLYILTYYIALVSHHDISGRQAKAKALVYSNAMRQTEDVARADDMWDTRCKSLAKEGLTDSFSASWRSRRPDFAAPGHHGSSRSHARAGICSDIP